MTSEYTNSADTDLKKYAEKLLLFVPEENINRVVELTMGCGWLLPTETVADLRKKLHALEQKVKPDSIQPMVYTGKTWGPTGSGAIIRSSEPNKKMCKQYLLATKTNVDKTRFYK